MIKLENVTKILGERRILDGVNLEVRRGETLFVVGRREPGKV
jgi:ABC-type multidrug transport system ATPase subunit